MKAIQIDLQCKFLEAYRSTTPQTEVKYLFSIYLGEAINSFGGSTFLPFTVDVETNPEGVFFKIKGEVFVKGPDDLVKQLVSSQDTEPPEIWSRVYEEVLKMLSFLADSIQVSPPVNQLKT